MLNCKFYKNFIISTAFTLQNQTLSIFMNKKRVINNGQVKYHSNLEM